RVGAGTGVVIADDWQRTRRGDLRVEFHQLGDRRLAAPRTQRHQHLDEIAADARGVFRELYDFARRRARRAEQHGLPLVDHLGRDAEQLFTLLAREHRVLGRLDGGDRDRVAVGDEKVDLFFQRLEVDALVLAERGETGADDAFDRLFRRHGLVEDLGDDPRVAGVAALDAQRQRHDAGLAADDAADVGDVLGDEDAVPEQRFMHGEVEAFGPQRRRQIDGDAVDAEELHAFFHQPLGGVDG